MAVLVIDPRWFSVIGLVLDFTGVLVIAHGLLSPPADHEPGSWGHSDSGRAAWVEQGRNEAIGGLLLVALGFFSQLAGAVWTFF